MMKPLHTARHLFRTAALTAVALLGGSGACRAQIPAVQGVLNAVSLDSMVRTVRQLSGEAPVFIGGVQDTIRSRAYTEPGNEKAFQYLKARMVAYGLQLDSVEVGARKSLIATLPGARADFWILGGHYDGVGLPGQAFSTADDNASGCGAIVEAARLLSSLPQPLPLTVRFAFWDEEEQGFIGSTDFIPFLNPFLHRGYINVDMLGYDGNNDAACDLFTAPVERSQALANTAQSVVSLYNLGLSPQRIDPGPYNTDYAPFWNSGRTAIGLAEDMNGDRNPAYHTAADSLSRFNLPYYRKMGQWAIATLLHALLSDPLSVDAASPGAAPTAVFSGRALLLELPAAGALRVRWVDALGRVVVTTSGQYRAGSATVPAPEALVPGVYTAWLEWSAPGAPPAVQAVRAAVLR